MDKFTKFALTCLMAPLGNPNEVLTNWGVPFNIIGGSGVAKSARLGQICKALELYCFPIYSSTKQPEHFSGVPVIGPNGFSIECILPQVVSAIDVRKACLFLDEISTAPGAVQAALLSFINERQVGEYVLPPSVRIIMAMNPPDIAANGQELTIPMMNRAGHQNYINPTIPQWENYMSSLAPGGKLELGLPSFKDAEKQVKSTWAENFEKELHISAGFLKDNGGLHIVKELSEGGKEETHEVSKFYNPPGPDDPRASKPWPTPRTWSLLVFGTTAATCLEMDETVHIDVASSLVGEGLAVEWFAYRKKANLPSSEDALDGRWSIPKRMDIVRAVLGGCVNFVVSQEDAQDKFKRAKQCWDLLRKCMDKGYSDIVVQPARVLIHARLDSDCPSEQVADAAEEVCAELNDNGMLEYILRAKRS